MSPRCGQSVSTWYVLRGLLSMFPLHGVALIATKAVPELRSDLTVPAIVCVPALFLQLRSLSQWALMTRTQRKLCAGAICCFSGVSAIPLYVIFTCYLTSVWGVR